MGSQEKLSLGEWSCSLKNELQKRMDRAFQGKKYMASTREEQGLMWLEWEGVRDEARITLGGGSEG